MYLQVKVFGDRQFDRKLTKAGVRAVNNAPVLEAIGFFLAKVQKEQFDTEGARSGHPWAPLADSTVARKGSDTILEDTGDLRESFQYGDTNNIFEVTPGFLRYGSEVEYGIFHQQGTAHLPVRKVMDLTEADKIAMVKSIQRWIIEGELINLEVGIV